MSAAEVTLSPGQLAELARLIAVELREAPEAGGLVDAATLAERLGVSRDFVYENKVRLGGEPLGDGPRPRWRFDVEKAMAAMADRGSRPEKSVPRRRVRRPVSSPNIKRGGTAETARPRSQGG